MKAVRTKLVGAQKAPLEPGMFGHLSGRSARAHEFEWHRLVSIVALDATDAHVADFEIDWAEVARGWHPDVFLPGMLPHWRPGLTFAENSVAIEISEPAPDGAWVTDAVREAGHQRALDWARQLRALGIKFIPYGVV